MIQLLLHHNHVTVTLWETVTPSRPHGSAYSNRCYDMLDSNKQRLELHSSPITNAI